MCRKLNYFVSFLLVLAFAGAGTAQGIDPNLVGWWKLDEGEGQITLDETDYWNDGTLYGGPLWIDGRIGGALDFDGVDDYVDCGNTDSLNITGQITMAAWINTRTAANGQHQHYLGKGNNSYCIKQNSGNNLEVVIYIGGWKVATYRIDASFGNEWHHMVGTYDGSSIKLYLDGELLATTNQTGAIGTNADPVRIGTRDGTRWYHTGGIDDARIYNRAISAVEVKKLASPERTSNPTPADGSVTTDPQVNLQWDSGLDAVTHNLYLSDDEQAVIDGTVLLTSLSETSYGPLELELGKTYYWRVDEIGTDGTTTYTGEIWSFTVQPLSAYNPNPANGTKYVDINTDLAWSPGFNAVSHDIYFGTDRTAMLNADPTSPEYKGNQTELTLELDTLEYNTVYYWQVDEHNSDMTITNGELWSFRTIPEISITDPNLVGWWKLDDEEGKTALDWSGYGNNGSIVGEPEWIIGQFEGALALDGIDDCIDIGNPPSLDINDVITVMAWVKMDQAGNGGDQSFVTKGNNSYGLRHAGSNNIQFRLNDTIYVDSPVDGSFNGVWHHVTGTCDGSQLQLYIDGNLMSTASGSGTVPNSIYNVNIGRESVGNRFLYTGAIDDVKIYDRVLTIEEIQGAVRGNPLLAWNPSPGNGALLDLITFSGLSWSPGDAAVEHDVYFGTDKESVVNADTSTADIYRGRQQGTTFTINQGVQANQTYFWRIDEINNDSTITKGGIWALSIANYLIVENFESYNDIEIGSEGSNLIYATWVDGYVDPPAIRTNGSTMGYVIAFEPSMELDIVHGGGQSAPIFYDNTTVSFSEVTVNTSDLPIGTNWTFSSPDTLSLWIYGDPNNSTTEQMYVKINNTKVVYDGNLTTSEWQQWTIDLATLGVNLNNVTTLSVGFEKTGTTGGTGIILVDDIRLLLPADEQAVLEQ